jgi:hypothetical protein
MGGLIMMNSFAIRGTNPKILREVEDPVGPDNDEWLVRMKREAGMILVAWGNHGLKFGRQQSVLKLFSDPLYCLGVTRGGAPRHPLYLRQDAQPVIFRA